MAKRFLTGIISRFITITEVPVNPLDGVNKQYVDPRLIPIGGTVNQVLSKQSSTDYDVIWQTPASAITGGHITIDMGTFLVPNGIIDCGGF